jgi:hypothetical protein
LQVGGRARQRAVQDGHEQEEGIGAAHFLEVLRFSRLELRPQMKKTL